MTGVGAGGEDVDKIIINQTIFCKQNKMGLKLLNSSRTNSGRGWQRSDVCLMKDLKKYEELTFVATIDFLGIINNGICVLCQSIFFFVFCHILPNL